MIDLNPTWWSILMFGGLVVGLFMGHPLAFVLGGLATIFGILAWGFECFPMFINRIYGTAMENYTLIAVPLFIFMALLLNNSGVVEELFDVMSYFIRKIKGGIALVVIIVSTIFGACTGITGASIVTMGLLSLPVMLKSGYDKKLSTGTVCAGGTLGILIPPSIMLVFMGSETGISVGKLFAGAIVPGLLLAFMYAIYILIISFFGSTNTESERNTESESAIGNGELSKPVKELLLMVGKSFVPPAVLITGVMGSIFLGIATPTEAAGVGAFLAFLLVLLYGKFTWTSFFDAVLQTGRITSMALIIVVGATCFTGVFLAVGGGESVEKLLLGTGLGKWGIFGIMMAIFFIMGMFLDWIGIVMIAFPVMMPIVETLGFNKLWFTVISAVILQSSFLTPPFGYALFYIKGVSPPGIEMHHIYLGIIPFVLIILAGTVLCIIFPTLITWLPSIIVK